MLQTQGNSTLATALDDALFAAFNGSLASNEAAVYCASNADICLGKVCEFTAHLNVQ